MGKQFISIAVVLIFAGNVFAAEEINRWAVVVGISKYQDPQIDSLNYADKDAEDFAKLLQQEEAGKFPEENIKTLINEEATTRNILKALRGHLAQSKPQDVVVIFFTCHGESVEGVTDDIVSILTYDTEVDYIAGTALPMREIQQALNEYVPAETVIVLLDACKSGGALKDKGVIRNKKTAKLLDEELQQVPPGLAFLTSSDAETSSFEDVDLKRGVFTHYLIEGIQKGNADTNDDDVIRVGELFDYVIESVRKRKDDKQIPQTNPNFNRDIPIAVTSRGSADSRLEMAKQLFEHGLQMDEPPLLKSAAVHAKKSAAVYGLINNQAAKEGESLLLCGKCQYALKRYAEAAETFKSAQQLHVPDIESTACLYQAACEAKLRKKDAALDCLQEFQQKFPERPEIAWAKQLHAWLENSVNRHALLIGVDRPGGAKVRSNDVNDLERVLIDCCEFSKNEITKLNGDSITLYDVVEAIDKVKLQCPNEDDIVLLYFSGDIALPTSLPASRINDLPSALILNYGTNPPVNPLEPLSENERLSRVTSITRPTLRQQLMVPDMLSELSGWKARKWFILDTGYVDSLAIDLKSLPNTNLFWAGSLKDGPPEDLWNGIFTRALVDALRSKYGPITNRRLFRLIEEKLNNPYNAGLVYQSGYTLVSDNESWLPQQAPVPQLSLPEEAEDPIALPPPAMSRGSSGPETFSLPPWEEDGLPEDNLERGTDSSEESNLQSLVPVHFSSDSQHSFFLGGVGPLAMLDLTFERAFPEAVPERLKDLDFQLSKEAETGILEDTSFHLGKKLLDANEFTLAEKALARYFSSHQDLPSSLQQYLARTMVSVAKQDFDEALKSVRLAISEQKQSPEPNPAILKGLEQLLELVQDVSEGPRALLVGIGNYKDKNQLASLPSTADDLKRMEQFLRKELKVTNITILKDDGASRESIIDQFEKLAEASKKVPCIFYFSGYGSIDGQFKGTILSYDARSDAVIGRVDDIGYQELADQCSDESQLISIFDSGWGLRGSQDGSRYIEPIQLGKPNNRVDVKPIGKHSFFARFHSSDFTNAWIEAIKSNPRITALDLSTQLNANLVSRDLADEHDTMWGYKAQNQLVQRQRKKLYQVEVRALIDQLTETSQKDSERLDGLLDIGILSLAIGDYDESRNSLNDAIRLVETLESNSDNQETLLLARFYHGRANLECEPPNLALAISELENAAKRHTNAGLFLGRAMEDPFRSSRLPETTIQKLTEYLNQGGIYRQDANRIRAYLASSIGAQSISTGSLATNERIIDVIESQDIREGGAKMAASSQAAQMYQQAQQADDASFARRFWPNGTTLKVFIYPDESEWNEKRREIIQEAAGQWSEHCNIRFDFNPNNTEENSQVRIDFGNSGTWSYLGTDALNFQGQTMNLSPGDPETNHFRHEALHQFGHVLGLVNEYMQPNAAEVDFETAIPWLGQQYGWTPNMVEQNFRRMPANYYGFSKSVDHESVMAASMPGFLFQDRKAYEPIGKLTGGDKQLVARLYPKDGTDAGAPYQVVKEALEVTSPLNLERIPKWENGQTVRIAFFNGNDDLKAGVADIAKRWTEYANLRFEFVDDPESADVRVEFGRTGHWTIPGTIALKIPKDKPTMSLQLKRMPEPGEYEYKVVLAEFGSAIGLVSEHQQPDSPIRFNQPKTIQYFLEKYGWSREATEKSVLLRYADGYYGMEKPFDPQSIMTYDIPKELMLEGEALQVNLDLSEGDKWFVARLYPRL